MPRLGGLAAAAVFTFRYRIERQEANRMPVGFLVIVKEVQVLYGRIHGVCV
ncbi:hypothetical protein [Paenibacillus sp. MER TA 81-3]|uniref:hypothetical protein n=1 Tax=Paenibacillus sp. MER TA 81-3 TaxID=2939573 RepID=UPI00203CE039|nr:hypothetical protein [Paenibacillus sp. MER TA 81-3]